MFPQTMMLIQHTINDIDFGSCTVSLLVCQQIHFNIISLLDKERTLYFIYTTRCIIIMLIPKIPLYIKVFYCFYCLQVI